MPRTEDIAASGLPGSLPNRELVLARLERALGEARRRNEMLAVMGFQVDDLQAVNDACGRDGSDRLLRELDSRARTALRDRDTVLPVGDGEFLVVATRLSSVGQVEAVAARLVARLGEPFALDGRWLSPSICLGVALYPEHGRTAEALVAKSDAALYAARRQGKGRVAFAPGPAA